MTGPLADDEGGGDAPEAAPDASGEALERPFPEAQGPIRGGAPLADRGDVVGGEELPPALPLENEGEAQPNGPATDAADAAPASAHDGRQSGRRRASPEVRALAGWVRVIGGAIVFALALRVLAFEAYRIPSTSMEDTLLVGDFVLVSKLHYGARVLGRRLPGLGGVGRGDVAVFNYPPDLDPDPARKTPYIKRIVGLPGDTLAVVGKAVRIGSRAVAAPTRSRQSWLVQGALPDAEALEALGLGGRVQRIAPGQWAVSATQTQADRLADEPGVDAVEPRLRALGDGSASFPPAFRYSLDDYGPVVVPRAGDAVVLDDLTWPVIRTVVERFEGHTAERAATGFLIDGQPAETYTFSQDYYFALGDSRDDSADSRTWGFVPFDHVIGKAVAVYFSWDEDAGTARWGRIGRWVAD